MECETLKESELIIQLTVKVYKNTVQHELYINADNYNYARKRDVEQIINEDVDYLLEDMRRRVIPLQK
jgi:hypothetical protein